VFVCGRYGLFRDPGPIVRALGGRTRGNFRFVPHYNVAPTQPVLGIANDPERTLANFHWGLVSNVPGEARRRISTINARIETVATSPLYGPLLPVQRCALFADGYYEWHLRRDGTKQPMWIERRDGRTFAFAGLWQPYFENGAAGLACTIVTQPANPYLAELHERMPVVLAATNARRWLEPGPLETEEALALLEPAQGREWSYHPVGEAVGNVRNDAPELIARAVATQVQPSLFDALEW
jgi:putative SOS response-associated peptidase YedK